MNGSRSIAGHLRPWWGLVGGLLGWALSDQIGSDLAFDHCQAMNPWVGGLLGAAGLLLAAGGGMASFRVWRGGGEDDARRFIGAFSAGAAGLFAISIILQTAATMVIPSCHG